MPAGLTRHSWPDLAADWADHYGASAIYLRLNGILPPTAQPKAAM